MSTSSTQDKIKGAANTVVGNVKHAVAEATEDHNLKDEASLQKSKGQAQSALGSVKEAIQHGLNASGEVLEKVGEKLKSL